MSQVLDFRSVARASDVRTRPVLRGDESGEFWLEVSPRDSQEEHLVADWANAPRRVFFEMALVLAVAGFIAASLTSLAPALA